MYRVTIKNYISIMAKSGKCTSMVLRHFSDHEIAEKFAAIHNNDFSEATVSEVPDVEATDQIIYPED